MSNRILPNAGLVDTPYRAHASGRESARLLALSLIAPLLGACAGGTAPPPGPPAIVYVMPQSYGVPGRGFGSMPAVYTQSVDHGDEVLRPSTSPRQENASPASGTTAPAGAATAAPPSGVRPPPDREANASRRSPTCGYWRLGCGILWP